MLFDGLLLPVQQFGLVISTLDFWFHSKIRVERPGGAISSPLATVACGLFSRAVGIMLLALQRRFRRRVVVRDMRGEWGEERCSVYTLGVIL